MLCDVVYRDVKNQESGLDLSVPSYKEVPGLFGKNVFYQVVAVSRLQCFKSPKHKDADVVQFMVQHMAVRIVYITVLIW